MRSKKAQGISMEVIVIAVIALIVLAVLSYIFISRAGGFGSSASDCEAKAENAECQEECDEGEAPVPGLCDKEGEICCVPLT